MTPHNNDPLFPGDLCVLIRVSRAGLTYLVGQTFTVSERFPQGSSFLDQLEDRIGTVSDKTHPYVYRLKGRGHATLISLRRNLIKITPDSNQKREFLEQELRDLGCKI